jgi:chromosome partitioning protein
MKILCTHNDGGVGKTSLAVHVVGALQTTLGRTLVIDCDDQADTWQFFNPTIPAKDKDVFWKEDITVVCNKNRESIKRLAKPEQYDHVVLDMDSPLKNTVQIIVGNTLDLVLIPVNKSQKKKALRNLPRTLNVIASLESKTGTSPRTTIVPLGIERDEVVKVVESVERKPRGYAIAPAMPNLEDLMQDAIYEDRRYIWQYEGNETLKTYFRRLIGLE